MQINAVFLADELAYGSPAPQAKIHLQLLWPVANDDALNGFLLRLAEHPAIAFAAASGSWTNGGSACQHQTNQDSAYGRVAQAHHLYDSHDLDGLFVQPHDLACAARGVAQGFAF